MDVMTSQDPNPKKLGTTSYAVLGLLSLRDWTTYELAQQMERGIGRMWAASPSMVYEEPKHLVTRGYATVTETPVGRRPRSSYSITPAGRRALAHWLAEEPAPPSLQFEGLLKVLFADQGDLGANAQALLAISSWGQESRSAAVARAKGYLDGDYIEGVGLAGRSVIVAQTLGFLAEFYDLIGRWSTWAAELADSPTGEERARSAFAAIASDRRLLG